MFKKRQSKIEKVPKTFKEYVQQANKETIN